MGCVWAQSLTIFLVEVDCCGCCPIEQWRVFTIPVRSDGRKWFARMGRFQVAPTQARSRASLDFLNRFAGKVNLPMVKIAEVSDIFMIGKHVLPCRYLTYFTVVFVHLIDDMVPSVDSAVPTLLVYI